MSTLLQIAEFLLRFIQDTNFIVPCLAFFICFLVLKKRKLRTVRIIIIIPYILLTNHAVGVIDYYDNYLVYKSIHFGYLLYFSILILIIWFIFEEKISKVMFFSTIAYLIENVTYQFGNVFYLLFFNEDSQIADYNSPKPIAYMIFYEFLLLLSLGLTYLLAIKKLRKEYDFRISPHAIIVIEIVVIFIIIFLNYYGTMNNYMNVVTRVYAFCTDVFIIFFEVSFLNESNLKYENQTINTMLMLQEKQYQRTKANDERINILIHDLKRRIKALNELGNDDDKKRLVNEIQGAFEIHEAFSNTGNKALDLILNEKRYECIKKKILITAVADGKAITFMDNSDIYIMLSNALDNSIESLEKEEEKNRQLSINISKKNNWAIIQINNYCSKKLHFENNLPITTKDDKRYHGYGLKSIQNIVKKYNGLYKVSLEDNVFKLKIVFDINHSS